MSNAVTNFKVSVYRKGVGAGYSHTAPSMVQAFDAAIKKCNTPYLTGISATTKMRYGPDIIKELENAFEQARALMMRRIPRREECTIETENAKVIITRIPIQRRTNYTPS